MKFKITTIKGKRKTIGYIRGLSFFKHIQFSKHYFRMGDALGVDVKIMNALISKGILRVVFIDDESKQTYETPVKRLLDKNWIYPKKGDKQYGRFQQQNMLALDRWTIRKQDGTIMQIGKATEFEEIERERKKKEYEKKEHDREVNKIQQLGLMK